MSLLNLRRTEYRIAYLASDEACIQWRHPWLWPFWKMLTLYSYWGARCTYYATIEEAQEALDAYLIRRERARLRRSYSPLGGGTPGSQSGSSGGQVDSAGTANPAQ